MMPDAKDATAVVVKILCSKIGYKKRDMGYGGTEYTVSRFFIRFLSEDCNG